MGPVDPSAKNPGKNTVVAFGIFYTWTSYPTLKLPGHVTAVQKCSLSGLVFSSTCTFPFDQPVISSGTPSESRSKL